MSMMAERYDTKSKVKVERVSIPASSVPRV